MPVAEAAGGADECPTFQPSAAEFRAGSFLSYVASVEAQHPGLGMFKVKAPAGWSPSSMDSSSVDALRIEQPIRQNAFGGRGVYRQVHVEQRSITVKQFRELASLERNRPPDKTEEELARQFWRGVELNPPLYGADLPMSLFDEALPFGWNLRRLGCLLQQARVPSIPGVTSPMCYVGSWRANFAWHTEDADLYSINYLHTGAPKSWYCVPPAARARFESAAAAYFPQLARSCPAFLRHKDIMISPTVLRQHGIPFTCTVQRAGEFVVNTAGAYHCGFNHGFNLAEAVNFATPSWPAIGRNAQRCLCCSDAVSIDMRLFGGAAAVAEAKADAAAAVAAACSSSPRRGAKAAASGAAAAAVHTPPPKTSAGDVVAVVGQDASRKRYMYLGRVLGAGALGCVRLEWLKPDDADGVYRAAPSAEPWEEEEEALITAIRYDVVAGAHAGIRLRTSAATLLGARLTSDEKPAKRAREK